MFVRACVRVYVCVSMCACACVLEASSVSILRYLCRNSGCVSWDTPTHVAVVRTRRLHVACAAHAAQVQRSAPGRVLGCTRSLAPDMRCSINTVLLGICVCVVAESCIQKGQAYTHWAIPLETMAASLQQLLANRNAWSQAIKLELFEGQKNIFGAEATRKKDFALITGAITPHVMAVGARAQACC